MKKSQIIYLPIKRLIGIIGSFVGIVVCSALLWWWVIPINTIATKGHPFFANTRIGKNGMPFKCLKFRSMFYGTNPTMTSRDELSKTNITGFGKFLRASSVDETLQLFNIFIGQMAFIGPRPLIEDSDDIITIDNRRKNGSIVMRPGLSGYAQLHNRGQLDPVLKAEFDYYYYKNFSLWFDVKIFVRTIFSFFDYRQTSNESTTDLKIKNKKKSRFSFLKIKAAQIPFVLTIFVLGATIGVFAYPKKYCGRALCSVDESIATKHYETTFASGLISKEHLNGLSCYVFGEEKDYNYLRNSVSLDMGVQSSSFSVAFSVSNENEAQQLINGFRDFSVPYFNGKFTVLHNSLAVSSVDYYKTYSTPMIIASAALCSTISTALGYYLILLFNRRKETVDEKKEDSK